MMPLLLPRLTASQTILLACPASHLRASSVKGAARALRRLLLLLQLSPKLLQILWTLLGMLRVLHRTTASKLHACTALQQMTTLPQQQQSLRGLLVWGTVQVWLMHQQQLQLLSTARQLLAAAAANRSWVRSRARVMLHH
jgi:hypothetical protein